MKKLFICLITILIIENTSCQNKQINDLVIQNVRLFDGEKIIEHVTVVTNNGIITEILSHSTNFNGDNVIDGIGSTLIPGLINAHIHRLQKKDLQSATKSGVLSLLDLCWFGSVEKNNKLRAAGKTYNHAYYYSSGPSVTVVGGHGAWDGVPTVKEIDKIPEFVRDRLDEGADYIKIIVEKGAKSNPIPTLTDDMLVKAIQTSNEEGVVSVVHISSRADAIKTAELGASGLAHIWITDSSEITNSEIEKLKKTGVFIIPTLFVYQQGKEQGMPVDMELLRSDLLKLYEAGIPILAGTDSPNFGINHGSDLIKEIELLVQSGLSEIDALKSATSQTSKSFNLGQRGFIKEGYSADFILIKGDPTINIQNLRSIKGVWKMGKWITPERN